MTTRFQFGAGCSTRLRAAFGLAFVCAFVFSFLLPLQAQPPQAPAALRVVADTAQLPPLPALKPPVAVFREMLAMTSAAREQALAGHPPQIRQRILAKLQEYEAMKPEERELRLRMTELRWYLLSFVELPPESRSNQLTLVPAPDRKLVSDSLRQWDLLSADQQKEILKYDKTMDAFVSERLKSAAAANRIVIAAPPLPPNPFNSVSNFMKLAPGQRQRMYASFQRFFDLSDAEKQKTLALLPAAQRLQMAGALAFFSHLPKPAREQYLNSFDQLSTLSDAERQEFLNNAERWRALSPDERQAWRTLIHRVPPSPPLPPGMLLPPTATHPPQQASAPAANN